MKYLFKRVARHNFKKLSNIAAASLGQHCDARQTINMGKPRTKLTGIATALDNHFCQPPVFFLPHLKDKKAIYCKFVWPF
jgi:hypothetical protein